MSSSANSSVRPDVRISATIVATFLVLGLTQAVQPFVRVGVRLVRETSLTENEAAEIERE